MAKLIHLDGNEIRDDLNAYLAADERPAPDRPHCVLHLEGWLHTFPIAGRELPPQADRLWLGPEDEVEQLGERARECSLIAIRFPSFMDGRGYSTARLLRERYGFSGELRAIGDVLVDQVWFMRRCGFDAFALRGDQSVEAARAALQSFSVRYQAAADVASPLFRQCDRKDHANTPARHAMVTERAS